jgi:hypothetical protein
VVVDFHGRGDYRFRFREASRMFRKRFRAILSPPQRVCAVVPARSPGSQLPVFSVQFSLDIPANRRPTTDD